MTQYYGQECKPVAAVLVSEGDMSVCKRGAVSTSNTGLTEYLDYVDLSIVLRPFTACTRVASFMTHSEVLNSVKRSPLPTG